MDGSPPPDKFVLFSHYFQLLIFSCIHSGQLSMLMPHRKKNQKCIRVYSKCNFVLLLTYASPGIKDVQEMLHKCSSDLKMTTEHRANFLNPHYPRTATIYIQEIAFKKIQNLRYQHCLAHHYISPYTRKFVKPWLPVLSGVTGYNHVLKTMPLVCCCDCFQSHQKVRLWD